MSEHLDAPAPNEDRRLAITDLYVFEAGTATALVMNVGTCPAGCGHPDPFHPGARYEFRVHLDDHDREDVTYRVAFLPSRGAEQLFSVERLIAPQADCDAATGTVIARGRTGEPLTTREGGQVWAGVAVEPFYVDIRELKEVELVVQIGARVDLTRWVRGVAEDTFTGSTVGSIVLTVPRGVDGLTVGRHASTWATTRLAADAGGWRQTGRTGLPLIWRIFRPAETDRSGRPGQTHPADDPSTYGPEIAELVSSAVELLGTSGRPDAYADSVVERILPDLLPYIVGSPAVFGFGRFNGRRLADNAAEVVFSLVTNSAVPTGLRSTEVRRSQEAFPFVIPAQSRGRVGG